MSDFDFQRFQKQLIGIGIIRYKEHETLFQIAKRCAVTTGLPMAGAGMVMGIKAGTVALPGGGTISGGAAGFLAGLLAGTMVCTAANQSYRRELRSLIDRQD